MAFWGASIAAGRPSSRASQVFDSFQSRRTVCGETLSTVAVSSTLRPAKKRSSTTWALRASTLASDCKAPSSSNELGVAFRGNDHGLVQGYLVARTAPFPGASGQGVIDQDPTHHLGRQREKVGAILPLNTMHVHQPQEGLVDQGGRLQGVAAAFARHIASNLQPWRAAVSTFGRDCDSEPNAAELWFRTEVERVSLVSAGLRLLCDFAR